MDINTAMKICLKQGVKVYPELKERAFYVAVNNRKKITLGNQRHTTATINEALIKTWFFLAEKIEGNGK
jgi:hypothetical protein